MKFGHEFQQHLLRDGFPKRWVESAISYRQLKKCIKKVEQELTAIGLDADTLSKLLAASERDRDAADEDDEKPFTYELSPLPGMKRTSSTFSQVNFRPKLRFVIDEESGEPLHASLTPETKQYLHELALREKFSNVRITEDNSSERSLDFDARSANSNDSQSRRSSRTYRAVEIPLISDSQFFGMLQSELSGLIELQKEEEQKLSHEIEDLGTVVSKMTNPTDAKSKHDLVQWRKIFEMYLDSRIFFSTSENDPWANNYAKASKGLGEFAAGLQKEGLTDCFRRKEGAMALAKFLDINSELLQNLRFQEINNIATMKILKKFDKRTALGATPASTPIFAKAPVPSSLARAVCATLSSNLIATVPQLNDYLCPVCLSLAWRPVRLTCNHIFCIRCLIIMQKDQKDACPLCRKRVVMAADSDNLDDALARQMKKYFPGEVKEKQKANEKAAAIDAFGVHYDDKCTIM